VRDERFCFAVSPAARQRLFGVRLSDPKAVSLFRQSIEEYLGDLALFDPQFHTLGIKLYEAGAVRGIQINPGNGEIEAEVISGKRSKPCQVIVVPVAGKRVFEVLCSGYCSPLGCQHGAAVLLTLLEQLECSPGTPVQAPVSEGTPIDPNPSTMAGSVSLRLGGVVPSVIREMLPILESWWQARLQNVPLVDLTRLVPKTGGASFHAPGIQDYGYSSSPVYPKRFPPADVGEYLDYLLLKFSRDSNALTKVFAPVFEPSRMEEVRRRWDRSNQIEHWDRSITRWEIPPPPATEAPPELRLMLGEHGAYLQIRGSPESEFTRPTQRVLKSLERQAAGGAVDGHRMSLGSEIVCGVLSPQSSGSLDSMIPCMSESLTVALIRLFRSPELARVHVVSPEGEPIVEHDEPLVWKLEEPESGDGDYLLSLRTPRGEVVPKAVAILDNGDLRYLTPRSLHRIPCWPFRELNHQWPIRIPAPVVESNHGLDALGLLELPVPERVRHQVRRVQPQLRIEAGMLQDSTGSSMTLKLKATVSFDGAAESVFWDGFDWMPLPSNKKWAKPVEGSLVQVDRAPVRRLACWLRRLMVVLPDAARTRFEHCVTRKVPARLWPDTLVEWLNGAPAGIQWDLDAELASLREGSVVGRLEVRLEESDAGIDWFDLSTAVSVTDQTLSPEELSLLMKTSGKWVRLEGKGWRRLEFSLSQSDEQALADLGIGRAQIAAGKQRFHALQLARLVGSDQSMVRGDQVERIRDRLDRIQTVVQPGVPTEIHATLRPYQVEGFQFLSYLSMNGFGGILADDMGLGKTLQTLSWIAWLRSVRGMTEKVLVVCPKSVQENWSTEVSRFLPGLRVKVWRGNEVGGMSMDEPVDLHVIGYAQLRSHEEWLKRVRWGAVILDEAQAIKNPSSQTARAACALQSLHRVALSGTPIENRLLDLWSIFAFAMPGILGTRAQFVRQFDTKEDAQARRRLAARIRPFVLRRTKKEVARELPDRIEEDLIVELEGDQAALYRAELKRARAALLKADTQGQLDSLRFHLLTSLLRLRQICCHPKLLGFSDDSSASGSQSKTPDMESSKVAALVELLEPLMQEGQKVLVFSQFTGVLDILENCFTSQGWPVFTLTGKTEDRGALVSSFQSHDGHGVFLISLKAGGFGLNLTAASYVVLFDPWWNPAVEAQAIDRTHRIGQRNTVFAYRLIVKGTIEEKIRELQRRKGAVAKDILGEESFAQALTLSDFKFLLEE
jgi:hypothetical protein